MSDAPEVRRTDSADAVLDAVTAEFREQVARYAEREVVRSGRPEPVSASDILHAVEATAGLHRSPATRASRRELRLQILSSAYRTIAAFAGVSAVTLYVLNDQTGADLPSLLVVVGALAFAASTLLTLLTQMLRLRVRRSLDGNFDDSPRDLATQNGMFLASWGQLESAIREVVGVLAGDSQVMASPRQLRGILVDFGIFDRNDAEVFTDLLRQRNSVAHQAVELDREDLRRAFDQIQKLRSKLGDPEDREDLLRRTRDVPRGEARP